MHIIKCGKSLDRESLLALGKHFFFQNYSFKINSIEFCESNTSFLSRPKIVESYICLITPVIENVLSAEALSLCLAIFLSASLPIYISIYDICLIIA